MTIWFLLQVPVFHYTPASTETKGGPLYHEFHDDKIPHFVPIQLKDVVTVVFLRQGFSPLDLFWWIFTAEYGEKAEIFIYFLVFLCDLYALSGKPAADYVSSIIESSFIL